VSNEIRSLDFIPGTALRGAFYEALSVRENDAVAEDWFGPAGPRWSCGWPATGTCDDDWPLAVPMPKSFLQVKRDKGFGGIHGVQNPLGEPLLTEATQGTSQEVVWVPVRKRWLRLDAGGGPAGSFEGGDPEIDMHVALHYWRQGHRSGALYSREAIAPARCFAAFVVDGGGKIDWNLLAGEGRKISLALGKRRTVGGGATVKWSDAREFWPKGKMPAENEAVIQLMSDAILPGPNAGCLRGLDEGSLFRLIGVPVELKSSRGLLKAAASSCREVAGWSGKWGLPREQALAIEAGSVWRLAWEEPQKPRVEAWLDKIEREGLGLRRHEGFGWVAVNPPWLTATLGEIFCKGSPTVAMVVKEPRLGPQPWPGFMNDDRGTLLNHKSITLGTAHEKTLMTDNRKTLLNYWDKARQAASPLESTDVARVHDLIAICQRTHDVGKVVRFLKERAARTNPRGWDTLAKAIGDHLSGVSEKVALFYLECLRTELRQKPLSPKGTRDVSRTEADYGD